MLIRLYATCRVFQVVVVFLQLLEDAPVDWHQMIPYDKPCLQKYTLCSFAPRMIVYFRKTVSFGRIHIEDLLNQVLKFLTDKVGHLILARKDLFVELSGVGIFKWQIPAYHRKENDASGPDIYFQPVVFLAGNHLGRGVAGRSTRSLQQLSWLVCIAESEVYYFEAVAPVQQQVFWLQVAMDDIQLVEVRHTTDDLFEETTGLCLGQLVLSDDMVEELPFFHVLHHQEEMLGGLYDLG